MTDNKTTPGVERTQRISDDGLARLEKHLISGSKISKPVLQQWVKRYGLAAQALLKQHGIEYE
ncbi:MAG: hypothetical protein HOM11_10215 [Methylococcales bacterium]|jgi:hypothetical protein|nr:hypothetical protein [Methylococcales bacterium]MBT7445404.1 hypothetical protein [Methylococcales bacterium]